MSRRHRRLYHENHRFSISRTKGAYHVIEDGISRTAKPFYITASLDAILLYSLSVLSKASRNASSASSRVKFLMGSNPPRYESFFCALNPPALGSKAERAEFSSLLSAPHSRLPEPLYPPPADSPAPVSPPLRLVAYMALPAALSLTLRSGSDKALASEDFCAE